MARRRERNGPMIVYMPRVSVRRHSNENRFDFFHSVSPRLQRSLHFDLLSRPPPTTLLQERLGDDDDNSVERCAFNIRCFLRLYHGRTSKETETRATYACSTSVKMSNGSDGAPGERERKFDTHDGLRLFCCVAY